MGIPIPANNLGQILLDMLDGMDVTMKLNCMYINTQQILKLMMQNVPDYQNGKVLCILFPWKFIQN